MKTLQVGSDFSGVGAFNQSLIRLGVNYEEVFACDMDKFARQTFIHNYGEPKYYPTDVYEREIPKDSLDIYMTSPPCQAFSLAGKRKGKEDLRGILFFNSLEFIQKNNPRFFIFENVKGLLSDDGGNTFQEWVNYLGGKSVNGVPVLFPYDGSVNYHLYWQVLNSKKHGVPQNRERVFLVGIRDDVDNKFQFPKEEHLSKRLKDVLEKNVDDKYFLSDKMINGFLSHNKRHIEEKGQDGFNWKPKDETQIANCLRANAALCPTDNTIKIKSATAKGYEEAKIGDSINFSVPNSETRRGRVGKGVAQTLDTACNQGVIIPLFQYGQGSRDGRMVYDKNGISPCMVTAMGSGGGVTPSVIDDYKIRRLTPRECFRLMDFPDSFTWPVSDSQAYKQAGNSIVVNVLYKILKQLPL
jgi:DNA (cytosine-5)-methyltransferase 1